MTVRFDHPRRLSSRVCPTSERFSSAGYPRHSMKSMAKKRDAHRVWLVTEECLFCGEQTTNVCFDNWWPSL